MGRSSESHNEVVRILCPKLVFTRSEPVLQWLIGTPCLPRTIISTFRCIHLVNNSCNPDYIKESDELRTLLPRGFEVVGALKTAAESDSTTTAREAFDAVLNLRKVLNDNSNATKLETILAVLKSENGEVEFFLSENEDSSSFNRVNTIDHVDDPLKLVCEKGCWLRCHVQIKLPIFVPSNNPSNAEQIYSREIDSTAEKFKDSQNVYLFESRNLSSPITISSLNSSENDLPCGELWPHSDTQIAEFIYISIFKSSSSNQTKPTAPTAEYSPAIAQSRLFFVSINLDVVCYAAKELSAKNAISNLLIPALTTQLNFMKKLSPTILSKQHQLHPYHFNPPGLLHPITAIYNLKYGELEQKQVDDRKTLHLRLGLPLDRPLLRVANSIQPANVIDNTKKTTNTKGSPVLRNVHLGISNSGVSGVSSLIQGSYEYYHYLQDGFDDTNWGCAYRSLQTILSWFKLQHYTTIQVPSHREIQEALVEIGDKDPSFIGSREWIGAIELSFVLDKLLGVSCKIINVRSGAELPEKCRELGAHFESQGTPVMIGGGVLAYTLLGVDYNERSGESSFLILDPHYTGADDHRKIVNGGWCSWKNAVDYKGNNFFLHDKFYNLLLPQRPNMI